MNFVLNSVTRSLTCHKLLSPKNCILRRISILGQVKQKPILLDKSNHKLIYHFKYIVFPAGISKAKYKLPIISVPLISACFYFNQPKIAIICIIGSFLQFVLMYAVSRLSVNLIGKIYVNKEGEINEIIISSIDSNGNRRDESFTPDQLYLSEFPLSKNLGFLLVETGCSNKNYKISIKSAQIYDVKALKSVFQDIVFFMNL